MGDNNTGDNSGAAYSGGSSSLDLPAGMFRSGDNPIEIDILMHKRHVDGKLDVLPTKGFYTELNGRAIFEGDIVLGTADEIRTAVNATVSGKGVGIADRKFRWPKGIIPYTSQGLVRPVVEKAIKHWEEKTPIRFVPRKTHKHYISFEYDGECSSFIGRQGGKQIIRLYERCSVGAAIHEIGHALGLFHEQSRSDRDNFIEVIDENIRPGKDNNFQKQIQGALDLGSYDFDSIMHYPAKAFGVNGLTTIRVKGGQPIGQRDGLSAGDVASIKLLYPDLD